MFEKVKKKAESNRIGQRQEEFGFVVQRGFERDMHRVDPTTHKFEEETTI